MKRSLILFIVMVVSFFASAMFFFSSGFFDFEIGQVTVEDGNQVLSELNSLPIFNFDETYDSEYANQTDIYQEEIISLENIKDLEINSVSTEIIVEPTDSSEASFVLSGVGRGHELVIDKDLDELEVRVKYPRKLSGFVITDLTLYVKIPESYAGYLFLESVSGNIVLTSLNADSIETISGGVSLEKFNLSNDLTIDTISGNIEIETTNQGFGLDFDSISGNSNRENSEGLPIIEVDTISGNLEFN